ncbi:MAG TPA: beta galactosidase jelly roll domain-containing protein, partial [Tepidisphaeraceae bacterium]
MNPLKFCVIAALWCGFLVCAAAAQTTQPTSPREKLSMDFGWRFALGNANDADKDFTFGETYFFNAKAGIVDGPASPQFDDRAWREVDLPHDWAVELPFDEHSDGGHGFKPVGRGYPQNNIGWYRKKFSVANADAGKRFYLQFDGVFRNCTVFVNGFRFGPHESGYTSFGYDISDVINYGAENVVTVRVDASQKEGWWYEGAGIYRHVWLIKTDPLHLMSDAVTIAGYTKMDPANPYATNVTVHTQITKDDSGEASVSVEMEIFGPDGKPVGYHTETEHISGSGQREGFSAVMPIDKPSMWSPDAPNLYKLIVTVRRGDAITDRVEMPFGIRRIRFDK